MFDMHKDIPGFEREYAITFDGKVWSYKTNTFLSLRNSGHSGKKIRKKRGYRTVALWKDGGYQYFYVHRLVAQAFIPNPQNKPFVNHKDGNQSNNSFDNLEWVTHQENARHAFLNGLTTRGEKNTSTKLKKEQIKEIRNRLSKGESQAKLAHEYGVQQSNISAIHRRKIWAWVD